MAIRFTSFPPNIDYSKSQILEIEVTPETAKWFLSRNHEKNRKPSDYHIRQLTRDMEGGHWFQGSPDTITFSSGGVLIDGQHRLLAVVNSGATVVFRVETGLPIEVFEYLDNAKPRNTIEFIDIPDKTAVQSIANMLICLDNGSTISTALKSGSRIKPNRGEIIRKINDERDLVVHLKESANRIQYALVRLGGIKAYAAASYVIEVIYGKSELENIINELETPTSIETYTFVKWFTNKFTEDGRKPAPVWIAGAILRFAESYISGEYPKVWKFPDKALDRAQAAFDEMRAPDTEER